MANLINLPLEELENEINQSSPYSVKEKFMLVLFQKDFQNLVLHYRLELGYPLYSESKEIFAVGLGFVTKDKEKAVNLILLEFGLSEKWFKTIHIFLSENKIILPSSVKEAKNTIKSKWTDLQSYNLGSTKILYQTKKGKLLLHGDYTKTLFGVFPKYKLSLEINQNCNSEDRKKFNKQFKETQKHWLNYKHCRTRDRYSLEIINYIVCCKRKGLKWKQIREEIINNFPLSKKGWDENKIHKLGKEGRDLGF